MSYWRCLKQQFKDPGYYATLFVVLTTIMVFMHFVLNLDSVSLGFMLLGTMFMELFFVFTKAFSKYREEKRYEE